MAELATAAANDGQQNISFLALFLQGKCDACLDLLLESNRYGREGALGWAHVADAHWYM